MEVPSREGLAFCNGAPDPATNKSTLNNTSNEFPNRVVKVVNSEIK